MDCVEQVYSNDYYDLIIEYSDRPDVVELSSCVQYINNQYAVSYWSRENDLEFGVRNYTYTAIPKLYTTVDMRAMEASNILQIQNQPTLSLKGQGVLIGFMDTGERVIIMSS